MYTTVLHRMYTIDNMRCASGCTYMCTCTLTHVNNTYHTCVQYVYLRTSTLCILQLHMCDFLALKYVYIHMCVHTYVHMCMRCACTLSGAKETRLNINGCIVKAQSCRKVLSMKTTVCVISHACIGKFVLCSMALSWG